MIEIEDLRQERWLRRAYCEQAEQTAALIRGHHLDVDNGHELTSERDLITLLRGRPGRRVLFRAAAPRPETLKHAPVNGVELRRSVYLYGVAGRQRTPVASAILKMLARGGLVALHGLIAAGERRFGALERIPYWIESGCALRSLVLRMSLSVNSVPTFPGHALAP